MKKFIALIAIIALVATAAFATQTEKNLKLKGNVDPEDTRIIQIAASKGSLTITPATTKLTGSNPSKATVVAANDSEGNPYPIQKIGGDDASTNPELSFDDITTAGTVYMAVYNYKYTNMEKGNENIGAVAVTITAEDWVLTKDNEKVSNPTDNQKKTISISAKTQCTTENDANHKVNDTTGSIKWREGRQFAGESYFTFTASWLADAAGKELEAGSYVGGVKITYTID
ncbi:MAG: hypothetical protein HUK24_03160 [Sphaerochaetaceae bacterium]|nr:hypothetical protein [Sphaerochaetaceae bacterium]